MASANAGTSAARSSFATVGMRIKFDGPEVFIRPDPTTGDVVLSAKPTDWQGLLDAVAHNADQDFSLERRRARGVSFLVRMAHLRLATLVGA